MVAQMDCIVLPVGTGVVEAGVAMILVLGFRSPLKTRCRHNPPDAVLSLLPKFAKR